MNDQGILVQSIEEELSVSAIFSPKNRVKVIVNLTQLFLGRDVMSMSKLKFTFQITLIEYLIRNNTVFKMS